MKKGTTDRKWGGGQALALAIAAMFAVTAFAAISFTAANENNDDIALGSPGTYNAGDIAFINNLIDDKGLSWTKAPADGSSVPADWTCHWGHPAVVWTGGGTDQRIKTLDLEYMGIRGAIDVTGLDSLTQLQVYGNRLTSLNVSANTALTFLDVSYNQLTSLNVSANTALTQLYVASNQLTSLNVSANTALTDVNFGWNQLTSLDVSANTALTRLEVGYNQLTSLNVSANTALTRLYVSGNQLTSLDVSANTALTQLYVDYNQLTSLNVSANTALRELYVSGNQLTSLNVSANTALIDLYVGYNQLASLNVSANTALTHLGVRGNQLTGINVSGLTALRDFYCEYNFMTSTSDVIGAAGLPLFPVAGWDNNYFYFSPQKSEIDITGMTLTQIDTAIGDAITAGFSPYVIGTNMNVSGTLTIDTNVNVTWNAAYGGSALVMKGNGTLEILKDGSMTLTGLTAEDNSISVYGSLTVNGNYESDGDNVWMEAEYGGTITINGNVLLKGAKTGIGSDGGTFTVTGDVISEGDNGDWELVEVYDPSGEIFIHGSVVANGIAIAAWEGNITVNGNVTSNGERAIECDYDSIVHVKGNVSAPNGYAVSIYEKGIVKIDGTVTVADDDEYIYVGDEGVFLKKSDVSATNVDGYYSKYTDGGWTVLVGKIPAAPGPGPGPSTGSDPAPSKSNTLLYVGIAAAIICIAAVCYFVFIRKP